MNMVFDIQRGCTHDGPGIRTTVFFKGCTLKCFWCQNPESHSFEPEIAYYKQKCIRCGTCVRICQTNSLRLNQDGISVNRSSCLKCGRCASTCLSGALQLIGRQTNIKELTDIIVKDLDFYNLSGGGVTFSGGECLVSDLCLKLMAEMKQLHINTAVQTCGNVPEKNILTAVELCDLIMFDIKTCNTEKHISACGASNKLILTNLEHLKKIHPEKIQLRMCIVPGFNDNKEELLGLVRLSSGLRRPELIPFHNWGKSKYAALDRTYAAESIPISEKKHIEHLRQLLDKYYLERRETE